MLSTLLAEIVAERESNEVANFFYLKNTHREKLHSAQEFLKIKFLLLLIFSVPYVYTINQSFMVPLS